MRATSGSARRSSSARPRTGSPQVRGRPRRDAPRSRTRFADRRSPSTDARDEVAGELRGSLLEDLRARLDRRRRSRAPGRPHGLRPLAGRRRARRRGTQRTTASRGRADHRRARRRDCRAAGRARSTTRAQCGSTRSCRLATARTAPPRPSRLGEAIAVRLRSQGPSAFSSFCADSGGARPGDRRGGADARRDRPRRARRRCSSETERATASIACCSARWRPTPTRCAASTPRRSSPWSTTTASTAPTSWGRSRPTSPTTAT